MRTLIAAALAIITQISGAQLIVNGDFETEGRPGQPEGWTFAVARGECSGKWDTEHVFSGERSIRMAIPDDNTARAHWRYNGKIPVKPNTAYRLSMKVMAVNVLGEAYAICYENGLEVPDNWHQTTRSVGTHEWRDCGVEFVTRDDAEWMRLICKLRHGTGYAWFDDVTLEEIDEARLPTQTVRVFPEDDGFALQAMWQPAQWTQHGVAHLMRGHTNPLALYFFGPDKSSIVEPAIVIETTEGLTMRGPVVRGRGPMPEAEQVVPEQVERDGVTLTQWRFPIPLEPMLSGFRNRPEWTGYHHVYCEVALDAPAEGRLVWRMENAGELGPAHELSVRVSEDTPGPLTPPDDFRIFVQHTGALRHPEPDVREGLFRYLQTAGIVDGLSMTYYEPGRVGLDRHYQSMGLELHTWRFEGYNGSVPKEHQIMDSRGERMKSRVCPTSQLEHIQPWYDGLKGHYESKLATGLKRVIIDYEPPTNNVCFCPRCREAFAERSRLPADECMSLSGEEIRQKYGAEWGAFRAWQNGEIVKMHCRMIREITPEAEVGLCSWHGTEGAARNGADIRLFEPEATFHAPMIYTHGVTYHDVVQETCERTTRPVLPFIELADISQPRSLTPAQLRMNLLATGLCGGGGAVMWVGMECFDAEYMAAIARSVREIAALRKLAPLPMTEVDWLQIAPLAETRRAITVDGQRVEFFEGNPLPHLRAHIWGTERNAIVAVLNYDEDRDYTVLVKSVAELRGPVAVTVSPTGQSHQQELTGRSLGEGTRLTVPAQGLAAIAVELPN